MLARVGAARLRRLPPCLVAGARDRTRMLANALQKASVAVEARLDGAGYHAMELFKPSAATLRPTQCKAGDSIDVYCFIKLIKMALHLNN